MTGMSTTQYIMSVEVDVPPGLTDSEFAAQIDGWIAACPWPVRDVSVELEDDD
jgi:hypothetical protein